MRTLPIKGFESWYYIGEDGTVISRRFCIPLKTSLSEGYPKLNLYRGGKPKTRLVHRLLAEHFLDNPKNLPIVNHIDGDRCNFSLDNLEWVSASDNVKDGFTRGRIHPMLGRRFVDRKKVCDWCRYSFDYNKKRQVFCGKKCSNAYARSKIVGARERDHMGRFLTLALSEAGEL